MRITALAGASGFVVVAVRACSHCGKVRLPNIESPPTRNSSRRVIPSHVRDGRPKIRSIEDLDGGYSGVSPHRPMLKLPAQRKSCNDFLPHGRRIKTAAHTP